MAIETANPVLGVALHAVGGLAAASFYIPYKRVKGWSWESYWLVQGVLSWIIAPLVGALITIPDLWGVLSRSPTYSLFLAYFFGALWGIGGLTFGLSMRFLGVSLGYALALGFTMAFGTLVPPIVEGGMPGLLGTASGLTILGGVAVAIAGVAVCCYAGSLKEKELSAQDKAAAIREFVFTKGVAVAIFAGIMSACMAFALTAGQPIGDEAVKAGANTLFQTNAILVVVLLGGFTTNFIWCAYLNISNKTGKDYASGGLNYALAALGGLLWYLQFFFYGMGTTRLGQYNFASWTIHMSFIIVFSTLWGLSLGEWAKCSRKTVSAVTAGIVVLVLSTVVIGYGNYTKSAEEKKGEEVRLSGPRDTPSASPVGADGLLREPLASLAGRGAGVRGTWESLLVSFGIRSLS